MLSPPQSYFGNKEHSATLYFCQLSNLFVFVDIFSLFAFVFVWRYFCEQYFSTKPDLACLASLYEFYPSKQLCLLCLCCSQLWLWIQPISTLDVHMHPVLNSSFVIQSWLSGSRLSHLIPEQSLFGDNPKVMQGFFQVYINHIKFLWQNYIKNQMLTFHYWLQ